MRFAPRTPLLLAFGEHPGCGPGERVPADEKFFRSAVLPFLEECGIRRGRKAVFIHEYNIAYELGGMDRKNKADVRSIQDALDSIESSMKERFAATLSAGREPIGYGSWFDWGYLDVIADINRAMPGTITNIIEPLKAETQWHMWDQTQAARTLRGAETFDERVGVEKELIRCAIATCVGRSMGVVRLAGELRAESPERAIIIARGYAHRGMAEHFDYSDYRISAAHSMRGVPLFSSEAIVESFRRTLSGDELGRYARLSLYYEDYCRENRSREGGNGGGPASGRELYAEARAHALKMESMRPGGPETVFSCLTHAESAK